MARIEIVNDGTVRECAEGANLLAELLRAGAFVDNPCNGTGAGRSWSRGFVWHV